MEILKAKIADEMAAWPALREHNIDADQITVALARPPKPDMGDVAFGTFRLAKIFGKKPNEIASTIAETAHTGALIESIEAAGPYVNLRLNRARSSDAILSAIGDSCTGVHPREWRFGNGAEGLDKTLVIDLSSPNVAKPLAVHHIRSTMIGNAIKRLREARGWRVVGVNHLGDWGTGFGMLIAGLKANHPDIAKRARKGDDDPLGDFTVKQLNEAYKDFTAKASEDPALRETARLEFARLEQFIEQGDGDDDARANYLIWRHARKISLAEFQRIYEALGLKFEDWPVEDPDYDESGFYVGESFYLGERDLARDVIQQAKDKGVAVEDDGALVIFTHGKKKPPLFLEKSDGATSYHARDMAAALYRQREWHLNEMAYVVGQEQKLHFNQVFKALEMLGYDWAKACTHVDFGLILFKDDEGNWVKTSTRRGTAVMLEDLLDEAIKSAAEIMAEKNPELAETDEGAAVARAVGVGAVVFNDLKNGRRNNVKFDWDEVLNFTGDTGPYMQYQYVRMGSVLTKYRKKFDDDIAKSDSALLTRDDEWEILLKLADFPNAVERAAREFEPSIVARALLDIASATSSWWAGTKDTKIVGDDEALSAARVRLVDAIRKVIGRGLHLLGITNVNRM